MTDKVRSLRDLAALKKVLERNAAEARRLEAHAREQALREHRERELFAHTVGNVVPLRTATTVPPARPRPLPIPRQRERDEAAALRETISDEFDVESLLETDDDLSFRRRGIGPRPDGSSPRSRCWPSSPSRRFPG